MLQNVFKNIPAAAYVALVYLFIYLPVGVLVLFSFQDALLPIPPFQGPSLRWYEAVLTDFRIMDALWNSLVVAVISSALSCILGFLAAFGLARYTVRGAGVVQWLLVAPLSVSYLIIGMGLLITFKTMGIPKSLLAVIIGHTVINLPLAFAIIYSQMGEHQANLERAARDLGAAEWQVLVLITLPLLWPALMASFFLSFTLSWDEFIIALLVSRFEVTLPVEIWSLLRSGLNPKTNAVGSLVFIVSIILVFVTEFVLFGRRKSR
ncbi:ABC transporter, permease protein 2 (cluster 1, maltose/g3p/polyamine/iron) [Olavius sp. associated proteobacterium Delta 1]|nr:ABC transporter, permease protein 2 (cluster 1, maltose/g3p/polyamine/iron) [Olavius sp. associated proteobacterium Delta 1]